MLLQLLGLLLLILVFFKPWSNSIFVRTKVAFRLLSLLVYTFLWKKRDCSWLRLGTFSSLPPFSVSIAVSTVLEASTFSF